MFFNKRLRCITPLALPIQSVLSTELLLIGIRRTVFLRNECFIPNQSVLRQPRIMGCRDKLEIQHSNTESPESTSLKSVLICSFTT